MKKKKLLLEIERLKKRNTTNQTEWRKTKTRGVCRRFRNSYKHS